MRLIHHKVKVNNELFEWNTTEMKIVPIHRHRQAQAQKKWQGKCNEAMLSCLNINAHSIMNKMVDLETIVFTHSPDIIVITETWLISDSDITPIGRRILRKDTGFRGGSAAAKFRESVIATR